MKLRCRNVFVVASITVFLYGFLLAAPRTEAYYYGCGAGPCNGSYPCNAPYECNGGVCGIYFDGCSGATCVDNLTFDSSTCSSGNACAPVGTTATASWGVCSVSCGNGLSTCTIGVNNGCPIACTSPAGAIGSTTACCIDQVPQNTPSGVTCSQNGINRSANVSWSFPNGTGCSQPFGFNCSGNNDRFELRFGAGSGLANQTVDDALRSAVTGTFANWGTYTVQVCALNGFGTTCSPTTNCVLSPPTCTTSGADVTNANPNDACIATNPNLSASWGNNANQIEFLVDGTNPLSSPYIAQSGLLSSSPASYTPVLGTGTYYWNIRSSSGASPVDCISPTAIPTGMEINIDKTAPTPPVMLTPTWTPDPTCLGKYYVTYPWNVTSDGGCADLDALPYEANISNNISYASSPAPNVLYGSNVWRSAATTSYQSPVSFDYGTVIYGRVRARDSLQVNISAWSSTETTPFTVPSPTPYPTIMIQGNYIEDLGFNANVCVPGGMDIDPARLTMSLDTGPDATSSCALGTTSYTCYVYINNQTRPCAVPVQTVSVNSSTAYDGYEAVQWRMGNVCNGAPMASIQVDGSINNPAPTGIPLYFKYGAQTWFKTTNLSFNNRSARNNIIPNNTSQFDPDDDVAPPNNKYMIIGAGGVVLQGTGNTLNLGANATLGYSANNWYSTNYTTSSNFTPVKFADYMKSRKQYKTMSSTIGLTDGIYHYADSVNPLTITTSSDFDGKKIVIVADNSSVVISNDIKPAGGYLAIIAKNISIAPTVTEIDAILVGNTVTLQGVDNINYLKIDGNLIQLDEAPQFTNTRVSSDGRKPSLFIKFNQNTYLNLLQYLSISLYDWRQLQ